MFVSAVTLGEDVNVSKKMRNIINVINDKGPEIPVPTNTWLSDLVNYSNDVWKMLVYKHQGMFGADNKKSEKERYFNVSADDKKFTEMVSDMAIAASLLHTVNFRELDVLESFVPSSNDGKEIWSSVISGMTIKASNGTVVNLSDVLIMVDPVTCEHPEDDVVADSVNVEKEKTETNTTSKSDKADVIDAVFEEIVEPDNSVIYLGTTEGTPEDPLNGKPVEPKAENKKPVVIEKKPEPKDPETKIENTNKNPNPAKNQNKPQNNNNTPKANVEKAETPGDIKIREPEPVAISFGEALSSLVTFEDGTKQDLIQENVVPFQKSTADKKNNNRYIKMYPELKQFVEMTDGLKLVVKFSESNVKAYVHDDYRLITAQIYDPSVARSNMPYVATLFIDPNEIYNNGFNVLSSNRGNGNIFEEDCVKLTDKQNVLDMIRGGLSDDARVMVRNKINTYAKSVIQIVDFRPALSDNKKVLPEKTYQLLLPAVWAICEKTKALYGILNSVENEKKFSMIVAIDDNATGAPTEYNIDFDPEKYKGNAYKMTKVTDEEPVVVEEKKEPAKTQDKKPHTKEEAKAAIRKAAANGTPVRIVDPKQSNAQKPANQNK